MKNKQEKSLLVAITGMDGRAYKMMLLFLQGPCKGAAIVVKDDQAEVEILDGDSISARSVLEEKQSAHPERPVIVLSLQELSQDNIIFVKKPVQTANMLKALEQARIKVLELAEKVSNVANQSKEDSVPQNLQQEQHKSEKKPEETANDLKQKVQDADEQIKTSKHRTAMQLDEKGFSAFIGSSLGIDFTDPDQLLTADYNAENYYQGYVYSAINLSLSKGRILSLDTGWKPLILFPHTNETWIDADDKQLRAFSALPASTIAGMGNSGKGISVHPVDPKQDIESHDPAKFQSMDALLWKLAIWTSKGRYPSGIDINQPVYLKRWPNMTRFVVTPHAMRIAAVLIQGPRTLLNTAEILQIKPQYVFVFFSAAYTLGLAGQAQRGADVIIAPEDPSAKKKQGILGKIMSKLRGSN